MEKFLEIINFAFPIVTAIGGYFYNSLKQEIKDQNLQIKEQNVKINELEKMSVNIAEMKTNIDWLIRNLTK